MKKTFFGKTLSGKETYLYTLRRGELCLKITDFGSTLVGLTVPDKNNNPTDVVLGYDDISGYETDHTSYLGCNIGRNANRISHGKFELNKQNYTLDINDSPNNLHSGFSPYSKRIWLVETYNDYSITFSLKSQHMDQGFPGNITLFITYELLNDNQFKIIYYTIPDMDTIINITNHSYFNLNGEGNGNILNHHLTLYAEKFTPVDSSSIPTGEICPVENTPMDFRFGKKIGQDIDCEFSNLVITNGYDHNFIICKTNPDKILQRVLRVTGNQTDITMEIFTDYPGIQLYTANFLENVCGKNNHVYNARDAICFEPQFYPDAINHKNFPSPICKKDEIYRHEILYSFTI